jgi:hypothetical protein
MCEQGRVQSDISKRKFLFYFCTACEPFPLRRDVGMWTVLLTTGNTAERSYSASNG